MAEKEAALAYDREMQGHYQELAQLEAANRKEMEARNQKHAAFVASCNRTQTDTWDINDPARVRNEKPPRREGVACPASSIQKFEGEDDSKPERVRRQQSEVRLAANAQIEAQEARRQAEAAKKMAFSEDMMQNVTLAKQLAAEQEAQLQQRRMAYGQANIQTTAKHVQEAKEAEANRQAQCAAEITKMTTTGVLTEDLKSTYRSDGTGRRVPYHFKGFDQKQRQTFLDTQAQQIKAKRAVEQAGNDANACYAKNRAAEIRELTRLEHEQRAKEQAMRNHVRDVQLKQRVEQKAKLDHLNNVVYKNSCEEYLGYFGRS